MNRFPSFQQIISSSIQLAKNSIVQDQLTQFDAHLDSLPKKIKQLNADPYLFIFQILISKKQTIDFGLKQLHILISQNYITKSSLNFISQLLTKCLQTHSTQVVNIIFKIKQPNLLIFELFFQIYSTILLPEDVARRFRQIGYIWLIRVFQFKSYPIPKYVKTIYDKIGVNQIPLLISREEEDKQLQTYVHKIINTLIYKVQDKLQLPNQKKGKYLFCFMCGKMADFYCKDTKVPVCGPVCKKDHLLYIQNVNSINQKFSITFKQSVQKILMKNWFNRKSPSLSVDYLNAIFMFSQYIPISQIEHIKVSRSPIMIEKVWLFYSMYYQKKNQMFEHIFVNFLNCKNDYLEQLSRQYFVTISATHRILQVYWNYDHIGYKRLFPLILTVLAKQYSSIIVQNTIQFIFSYGVKYPLTIPHPLSGYFIQHFNQDQSPLEQFSKFYPQDTNQIFCKFILRNQNQIDRQRLAQILQKNQQLMKVFLKEIMFIKKDAPLDQILRQIFYFVNIKVSQKIYRLLELFYQVYEPSPPFQKNDVFFQFSYLIIMLVTEFHNPTLIQKPSLADILKRVANLNPQLAKNNMQFIQQLVDRVKQTPFTQSNRGQLKYYNSVKFVASNNSFSTPVIIIQNYEHFYNILLTIQASNPIIYKCCSLVIQIPQICCIMFSMLLVRLQNNQIEDQYIIQAIRNIIQQQPNAVGSKWGIILNFIKASQKNSDNLQEVSKKQQKRKRIFIDQNIMWLDIMTIIMCSYHLTDQNFMYFFKDFSSTFLIDSHFQQYSKIMDLNKNRLNLMANGIVSAFRKILNWSIAIYMIQSIANLPDQSPLQKYSNSKTETSKLEQKQQRQLHSILNLKQQIILLMLKQIPVIDTTQYLLVDLIVSLSKAKYFFIKTDMWETITHLTLKMKNQQSQSVVEQVMKQFKNCQQYYESLMIQKTLSNSNIQLISKEVLQKLDKLQPYLTQLPHETLRLFVLKCNYKTILKNMTVFSMFAETFQLFREIIQENKNALNSQIQNEMKFVWQVLREKIGHSIKAKIIPKQIYTEQFNKYVFSLLKYIPQIGTNTLQIYIQIVVKFLNPEIFQQKTILDRATAIFMSGRQLHRINNQIQSITKSQLQGQKIQCLIKISRSQLKECQKFNENYLFRQSIWKTYVMKNIKQLPNLNKQIYMIAMNLLKLLKLKQRKIQFNDYLAEIIQNISQKYVKMQDRVNELHQQQGKAKYKDNQGSCANLHLQKVRLKQENKQIKLYNQIIVKLFEQDSSLYEILQKQGLIKMQKYFLSLFYGGYLTNDLKHTNALSSNQIGKQIKVIYEQIIIKLQK